VPIFTFITEDIFDSNPYSFEQTTILTKKYGGINLWTLLFLNSVIKLQSMLI